MHETSIMPQFLHVDFNISLCRAQSVLETGENKKSILFFIQSYRLFKKEKTSNLKAHNNEKIAVKEKEPYSNII